MNVVTKKSKEPSAYHIFSVKFNITRTGSSAGRNSETSGSPSTSFRERITRQVWPFPRTTSQATAAGDDPLQPGSSSCLQHAVRIDDALIADLDALSLSEPEHEILKRMEQVCHAATVAQEKRLRTHAASSVHHTRHNVPDTTHLHLRGGGDDLPHSSRGPWRRTTLPYTPPSDPLPDSFRPSAGLWWLAGGQRSQHGRVPTLGELRVRKEVERANRGIVGFWGTALGLRRVKRVGILNDDGEADGGGLVGDVLEEDDGAVDDNAMGAAEANSVANSVRSSKKTGSGKGGRVSAKADVEDAAGSVHSAGQKSSKEAGVANERGSI